MASIDCDGKGSGGNISTRHNKDEPRAFNSFKMHQHPNNKNVLAACRPCPCWIVTNIYLRSSNCRHNFTHINFLKFASVSIIRFINISFTVPIVESDADMNPFSQCRKLLYFYVKLSVLAQYRRYLTK